MVTPVHRYQHVDTFWEQGRHCSEQVSNNWNRGRIAGNRGGHQSGTGRGTSTFGYPEFGQHAAVVHALRNGGAHAEIDTDSLLLEAGLISDQREYLQHQQRLQTMARLVTEAHLAGGSGSRPLNCIIWTCFMALALFVVPAQMFYGNHTEFFFFFVVPLGLLVFAFCVAIKQYFFPKMSSPCPTRPVTTQTVTTTSSAMRSNRSTPPSVSAMSTPATVDSVDSNVQQQSENVRHGVARSSSQHRRHRRRSGAQTVNSAASTAPLDTETPVASLVAGHQRSHDVASSDDLNVAELLFDANSLASPTFMDQGRAPPPYHLAVLMPNPIPCLSNENPRESDAFPGVHVSAADAGTVSGIGSVSPPPPYDATNFPRRPGNHL